jgi:Ca2+-binding RTX toxin-like protein
MATVVTGGDGPDTLVALDGDDFILRGFGGADLLTGAAGDDSLYGGDGDDRLVSDAGDDSLNGGAGDDFLALTGAGLVTALGGAGDDAFDVLLPSGTEPGGLVDGGGGIDEFRTDDATADFLVDLSSGVATGHGSSIGLMRIEIVHTEGGDDTLIGAGNSTLYAHGGDDQILMGSGGGAAYGGHGRDQVTGGDGANLIYGGENADTVYGGAGNDTINAALGAASDPGLESLFGGLGHDEILGGNSAIGSEFYGGEGNDTLISGALVGAGEQYFGGSGHDVAQFGAVTSAVKVWFGNPGTVEIAGVVLAFGSVEDVVMTGFDDFAQGDGAANRIEGGNGNDTIFAGGGDDTVYGGGGADVLREAAGIAALFGGAGDDRIYLAGATATGGLADGGDGGNDLIGAGDNAAAWQFDLTAGMAVSAGKLHSLAGFEAAVGGSRDDSLIGDAGANGLFGGNGADQLSGGGGRDTLTGGAGGDVFVFRAGDGGSGAAADVVTDFGLGHDVIDLTAFGGLVWRDAADFVPGGGQVRQVDVAGPDLVLQIDGDGDAVTDLEIVLQNSTAISVGDLLL